MCVMATISEYFAGKNIFLTGATGFMGKVLIEKLLRTSPDITAIYCLTREKKGVPPEDRLTNLFKDKLYDELKKELPDFRLKVKAILGNIEEENLGISEDDQRILETNIHVVFHCAANVKFDEHLRKAVEINVLGLRRLIQLCSEFQKLEVFQHVSTAYSNCDRKQIIEEVIYPSPIEPQTLIDTVNLFDDEMIAKLTPTLIGDKPNTYTYTKHVAETLLVNEGKHLPYCIVRPSIVGAVWKSPTPGWLDNFNGPNGVCVAIGKGILRSAYVDPNVVADLIPVDLSVNVMISSAWFTARNKPNMNIYQVTTGSTNPIRWGDLRPMVVNFFKHTPMESCLRRPKCSFRTNELVHKYWEFVSHVIPAHFIDLAYQIIGKKPQMVRLYKKINDGLKVMYYFTHNQWMWRHKNVDALREALTEKDQQIFYMNPREINWLEYIENYCLGAKLYLAKESLKNLPAAKANLKRLRNLRFCFNIILVVGVLRLLVYKSELARNMWRFVLGVISRFLKSFNLTSPLDS